MNWLECTMREAFEHARYRDIDSDAERPKGADFDENVIVFTDKTAVAVRSEWSGPLSEVTPDTSADDPKWRVFR